MSAACKPICKPDAPEWDETEETEQNERAVLVPVRRGHRIRERSSETRETYVALLITQRSPRQWRPCGPGAHSPGFGSDEEGGWIVADYRGSATTQAGPRPDKGQAAG